MRKRQLRITENQKNSRALTSYRMQARHAQNFSRLGFPKPVASTVFDHLLSTPCILYPSLIVPVCLEWQGRKSTIKKVLRPKTQSKGMHKKHLSFQSSALLLLIVTTNLDILIL